MKRRTDLPRPLALAPFGSLIVMVCGVLTGLAASPGASPQTLAEPHEGATVQAGPVVAEQTAWRLFRGDAGLTGVAAGSLPTSLAPLWVFEADDSIESTASIADGVAYLGSLDSYFYAIDLADGELRWKYQASMEIRSSPTVVDGVVYFGDEGGQFHALDAQSGEVKWVFSTGAGIISGANYVDGRLVFGSYDNSLYCLDAADGSLIWKIETLGYVNGTPAIVDGKVISVGCDGFCRVVRLEDGASLMEIEVYAYVGASPAIDNGIAYFGTFENQVMAISVITGELQWIYEHPTRKFPYYSSAAIAADLVFVGGRDKMLHAIDRKSGEAVWTYRTRARIDSSPVIVGDRVFFGASTGEVFALNASSGEVEWQFETGSSIVASPSIADGRMVIGTEDGQVYCFGEMR